MELSGCGTDDSVLKALEDFFGPHDMQNARIVHQEDLQAIASHILTLPENSEAGVMKSLVKFEQLKTRLQLQGTKHYILRHCCQFHLLPNHLPSFHFHIASAPSFAKGFAKATSPKYACIPVCPRFWLIAKVTSPE